MSKNDKSLVVGLLLVDPDTHEKLEVMSPLKVNKKDGSYSFACLNIKTGGMWKHTIKTEEITLSEMRKLIRYDSSIKQVGRGEKKTRRRAVVADGGA